MHVTGISPDREREAAGMSKFLRSAIATVLMAVTASAAVAMGDPKAASYFAEDLQADATQKQRVAEARRADAVAADQEADRFQADQADAANAVKSEAVEGMKDRMKGSTSGTLKAGGHAAVAAETIAEMKERENRQLDLVENQQSLDAAADSAEREARESQARADAARQIEREQLEKAARERAKANADARARREAQDRIQRDRERGERFQMDHDRYTRIRDTS